MKTELIFFENNNQSLFGIARGSIAFILLIFFNIIWLLLTKKLHKRQINSKAGNTIFKIVYSLIIYLLLCSAIAVQIPSSAKVAFIYGALIGLVVYGIFNFTNAYIFSHWNIGIAIIDIIWGIILCALVAILTYLLSKKWKLYLS